MRAAATGRSGDRARPGRAPAPAAAVRRNAVVHLGERPSQVAEAEGATVESTAWVEAVGGAATLAGVVLPSRGSPAAGAAGRLRGTRRLDPFARPPAQPVPALLAGVAWLFTVTAERVLDQHERRRRDAELARASEARAQEAELRAVELAEELRSRPEPVIPRGADPLVACATRVLATKNLELKAPRRGLAGLEGTAAVRELAATSKVYARRVTLNGAWWKAADEAVAGLSSRRQPGRADPGVRRNAVRGGGRSPSSPRGTSAWPADCSTPASSSASRCSTPRWTGARRADGRRGPAAAIATYTGWATVLAISGLAVPFASGVVFKRDRPRGGPHPAVVSPDRSGAGRARDAAAPARADFLEDPLRDDRVAGRAARHLGTGARQPGHAGETDRSRGSRDAALGPRERPRRGRHDGPVGSARAPVGTAGGAGALRLRPCAGRPRAPRRPDHPGGRAAAGARDRASARSASTRPPAR